MKVALLERNLSVHNMDIICLPESNLDSSVPTDDDNFQMPGYSFARSDLQPNAK